jgi:hypothetical protein
LALCREKHVGGTRDAWFYQHVLYMSHTKVLLIIVNIISLHLLFRSTDNWEKKLSLGATILSVKYLTVMHFHVCSKQISSEVALFAVLAMVGPERCMFY